MNDRALALRQSEHSRPALARGSSRALVAPTSVAAKPIARIDTEIDREIIRVIDTPIGALEGHKDGNDRKERELVALFAALAVIDAWHLHLRLSNPRPGDALAASFARLVIERRGRLLAYLGDARRRAALGR